MNGYRTANDRNTNGHAVDTGHEHIIALSDNLRSQIDAYGQCGVHAMQAAAASLLPVRIDEWGVDYLRVGVRVNGGHSAQFGSRFFVTDSSSL